MAYNYLQHLNSTRDDWFLKVRVVRLWNAYTPQNEDDPIFLEMILLDEKQTPLHVSVRKNLITKFKHTLQEGSIYTLRNLKIAEANESYKPIMGTMKGWFLLTTILKRLSDTTFNIPTHYFEFGSYQTLTDRIGKNQVLTDIVGRLHGLGQEEEIYVSGKPVTIRRLELKLKENEIVKVTLWRTIAKEFEKVINDYNESSKILALTSTTVKLFRDEISISSTSSTRIYINLQIPEFQAFNKGKHLDQEEIKELPSQDCAHNTPEKRMHMNRRTIQEIMAMQWESSEQEKNFTIHATINDIDVTFGWNYIACETCMKKLRQDGNQFSCIWCKKPSEYPTTRYKIQLKVSDHTASTTLTMFDKEAHKLLNTTASELLAIHNGDNHDIPTTLQNLCNRSLIFEIKLTDHNLKEGSQNYTITRTFVPNNIPQEQLPQITIKQEPISPTTISSDEDTTLETTSTTKATKHNQDNVQHEPISKVKSTKKRTNQIIVTSSDEEPILIQSLLSSSSKTKKLRKKSTTNKHKAK